MASRHVCATLPGHHKPAAGSRGQDQLNSQENGVLERNASSTCELAPPGATPTIDALPRRHADFATLGDALDYAATGKRGLNFHDARGSLTQAYPYAELRVAALALAQRL